jgi:uncharacterized protein (TIGR00369 family)
MPAPMDELIRFMENDVPFNRFLGLRVDSLERGFCRLLLPFRPDFVGDMRRPALHGGIVSTLADTAGGVAVWSLFSLEDRIATVDMRVDYLLPGPSRDLVAEAEVVRAGNRVGVTTTSIFPADDPDFVVAEGRAVYNIRRAPKD